MPRSKFDTKRFPKIDKLRACVLDRKLAMGETWDTIAEGTHVNSAYLRRLIVSKNSEDWNPKIRNALCRYLGLSIHSEIVDLFDLTEDGK